MKGIILAGGSGTRLYPMTMGISKQSIPIFDKPMIYYPLSTLMLAGIKDILVITTKDNQDEFKRLLGDGKRYGINLSYIVQPSPDGLAQAFLLGEDFIGNDTSAMVLGDNIFYGNEFTELLQSARKKADQNQATIFGYKVKDPERFGVMEIDENNKVLSVEEKPKQPKSDFAITGLYFYPKGVSEIAKLVKPSARGELEITTLNDMYLKNENLTAELLGGGYTWFDTGTAESNLAASNMIKAIQENTGKIICCPEQIGFDQGWLSEEGLEKAAEIINNKNEYGRYLNKVLQRGRKR